MDVLHCVRKEVGRVRLPCVLQHIRLSAVLAGCCKLPIKAAQPTRTVLAWYSIQCNVCMATSVNPAAIAHCTLQAATVQTSATATQDAWIRSTLELCIAQLAG